MPVRSKQAPLLFFVMLLLSITACGLMSRYRLDLYVTSGESQKKVKIEQSQLYRNVVVADPYRETKLAAGNGNVALITVGTRWKEKSTENFSLLDFDEYWRCRLYTQLPVDLAAGQIALKNNSFLQLLEKYDVDAERKIFLGADGTLTIDSVNAKAVYLSIDGAYENQDKQSLKFTGQFKIENSD